MLDGPVVDATIRRSLTALLALITGRIDGRGPSGPASAGADPTGAATPPVARIDTLLLGCTHYPLIAPAIRRVVGEGVAVIDSASATASALAGLLEVHALGAPLDVAPRHELYTTGHVGRFRATARRLFGGTIPDVEPLLLAGTPEPIVTAS